MIWTAVLLTAAGCFGFKAAGWALPTRVTSGPVVRSVVTMLPIALLAALVVVQTFGAGRSLQLDARVASVVVGALCLWRGRSFAVVLLAAAAAAAVVRQF